MEEKQLISIMGQIKLPRRLWVHMSWVGCLGSNTCGDLGFFGC